MAEGKQLPPRPRLWVIESEQILDEETGALIGYEPLDPNDIQAALAEAAMIVNRVGGVVFVTARREELPADSWGVPVAGVYGTTALVVKWESYAPAPPRPQPAPPEEALEPVAAG